MSELSQHRERRHYSPSAHVHVVETFGRGGVVLILAVVFVALGFGIAAFFKADAAGGRASLAEREARLAQHDAELLRATLIAHGLSTDSDQLQQEKR